MSNRRKKHRRNTTHFQPSVSSTVYCIDCPLCECIRFDYWVRILSTFVIVKVRMIRAFIAPISSVLLLLFAKKSNAVSTYIFASSIRTIVWDADHFHELTGAIELRGWGHQVPRFCNTLPNGGRHWIVPNSQWHSDRKSSRPFHSISRSFVSFHCS